MVGQMRVYGRFVSFRFRSVRLRRKSFRECVRSVR